MTDAFLQCKLTCWLLFSYSEGVAISSNWFNLNNKDKDHKAVASLSMFNVTLLLSYQACQLVAGQKQLRSPLCRDSGWLDGWNENFALQGGLLWGQLQLLRHPGQDLHWVRQPQTHTVSYPAYSCQECLQVPSTRGKTQEFEETIGEEHTHTCTHLQYAQVHFCSHEIRKAIELLLKVSWSESW